MLLAPTNHYHLSASRLSSCLSSFLDNSFKFAYFLTSLLTYTSKDPILPWQKSLPPSVLAMCPCCISVSAQKLGAATMGGLELT